MTSTPSQAPSKIPSNIPEHAGTDAPQTDASARYGFGENYRLLLKGVESIVDYAIFMLDPNGYVMTWNEGARRIKGYEANEIIGRHFSAFYTDEARSKHYAAYGLESAKAHARFEEEGWRIRKDGSLFWANVIITPVYDDPVTQELLGFTQVTRDLTERKEAEESLRQSEERFRLMVEGVKDYAIFMLNPDGYVATWNEGARRIKGYEANEIIGRHFSAFYPQEAVDRRYPDYELQVARAQGRFEDEGWRVRKDGSLFWANVIITALFNENNQLLGFSKVTRDLTERKRMIDELQQAKTKAEAMNKELESFSYSVSHDLRAPLRSIDGYTRLVLEDKADQLDVEAREYLERVSDNAQQMGKLIDDLLNLSRLSRTALHKEPVNLSRMAGEILSALREHEPKRQVECRIQENMVAQADPVLIRAALQNLLANAWKFTGDKEQAVIEFRSEHREGETVFVIQDNGAGFSMKYAQKLFGAFQRLHDVTEFPGSGIGLATVKRVLLRHGGQIWADAAEGKGATFYFTL